MKDFVAPPYNLLLLTKDLFGICRERVVCSITFHEATGGGPPNQHTHEHSHVFIIIEGQTKVLMDSAEKIVNPNESILVDGGIPHSVWNNTDSRTVMRGISIRNKR